LRTASEQPSESRYIKDFVAFFSRGARLWLFPSSCGSFSRFGRGFDRRWQFQRGLFRGAMVAMLQRLDARSFLFDPQLIVFMFLALVFKVCRNRFSCHDAQCGITGPVQTVQFWPLGDNS
jgi:hypothetical protein